MSTRAPHKYDSAFLPAPTAVWFISAAVFALLMWIAPRYGYFRDELYYLACAEHPAWGYVDQPPLIAWIAWLLRQTVGTSLYALRFFPALAASLTVWLTARLAREFGGSSQAEILAALFAAVMPVLLGMAHLFTMNVFDFVFWLTLVLLLVRLQNTSDPQLWLAFGAVAGLAVLNKYGVLFFLAALFAGTLFTPWRKWLANSWFWTGTLLAVFITLNNFLWQQQRNYPFLQLMHNIRHNGRDVALPPLGFFLQQVQIVNPFCMIVAIAGLVWLFLRTQLPAQGFNTKTNV